MSVSLRTPEEKQVDSVTKALLHGTPDLVYLNSSTCAACGIMMQMKTGKNQTAYYIHGRFSNPAIPQCVNADKVYLAEAIKLEVVDPEDYEAMGVDYVPPPGYVPQSSGRKGRHGRHKVHRRK